MEYKNYKGLQEPKEIPSDSPTFDVGVLLIATRNCWNIKLCDWQMLLMKIILLNWAYSVSDKEAHLWGTLANKYAKQIYLIWGQETKFNVNDNNVWILYRTKTTVNKK